MEAVFLKILELSCYGSLLILAVLPVRLLLGQAPKWMTCLLWAMVAVALICPVRIESPASVMPPVSVENAYTANIPDTAEPSTVTIPTEHRHQTAPTVMDTDTPTVTAEAPRSPVEIASMVWVCGMGLMLLYAILSVLRLRKCVGASLPTGNNVYLCDDIETPFILGLLRPRIYLPSAIDEDTAHQVLLHERAHLHRRDHWWKPLGFLLLTVHWFNPLVWVGYVLLCRDIELACDEKVVRDMAAVDKKRYTEALLTCSVPRHLIAACPLAFGEIGVKQRIKAVLNYKKPAFWVIVIAVILCIALCLGFLTNPAVTTLDELGDVTAGEIESVRIDSDASYHIYEPDALFDTLARLELRPTLFQSDIDGASHLFTMQRRENAAIYTLHFSPDCTRLQITRMVEDPHNNYQVYNSHYRVLNPEILTESDKSTVTTDYLRMDGVPVFTLSPESVERGYADFTLDNRFEFSDYNTVSAVCALLNSLEFTGERDLSHNNGYLNLQMQMTDESVLLITINAGFTKCDISLYRMVNGVHQGVLFTDSYIIGNPDLVKNSDFLRTVTDILYNSEPLPITDLISAAEESLNNGSVNWAAVTLPDSFLNVDELQCVVSYPYWLNDQGEIPNNTSLFFSLTYSDGLFALDYPEGSAIESLVLADIPFTVKVTPYGSDEIAVLSILLDPATGEIRSITTQSIEQITSQPTAAQLQAAIEEHLRNKNRHYTNFRFLGDAFYDPNTKAYFLLTAMDYTSADGTVLSENNLQLVSVMDFDSFLRIDGIVSGEWAKSAGIYPNVADFNGQLVLWTTRSDTHIKVSEDGTSVDADASEPNNIYKYKIYCENGNTHTWTLMDHGGVFILPEGDIPISVVPLDDRYNEILALGFGEESLDSTNVYTISEASGWDVFLNMDKETGEVIEVCSYPLYQPSPLYLDMDDSFADHAALYSAMKDCEKLPDISWSSLKLAGTLTYEGYEYAAMRYTEGRDPMALLIEYQTNADGTVTLRSCAKGYVPDEQGFLTGYRMNQSSMSCGTVYWSLFDTRYATSKNGKETNPDKSVEPAFTSFRFTMRDLKTHDFPVEGNFFMAKFAPLIPPAIVTPLEGKTLLAALGSEPMGGLTGTITLS